MSVNKVRNSKQFVLNYLNELELKPSKNIRQFWKRLDERHDKNILDELDDAFNSRDEGIQEEAVYDLKNRNLKLSLDVANFSADLYRRYFDWIIERKDLNPKTILDIGCDNGITACFYARLFPEAEVVGIDLQENSIKCANELATKLGLSNVKFLLADFKKIHDYFPNNSFDLITSLRSFHEIIGGFSEIPRHWSIPELLENEYGYNAKDLLKLVQKLLRDDKSEFITCERLPWINAIVLWAKELKNSGLFINWTDSQYIKFHEVGDEQQMPVLVTNKHDLGLNLLEGSYNLEAQNSSIRLAPNIQYSNALAEIVFHRLLEKELISGLEINFIDGSGRMRYELWTSPDQVIGYQYTNTGFRQLNLFPAENLAEIKEDFISSVKHQYNGQEFFLYETIQEREQINL
jgi:tRNA G46 methylase TrmB